MPIPKSPLTNTDHEIWTTKEVAAHLRISTELVSKMAKSGEIPARKFNSLWRFKRETILALAP